jgi:hypothetical protein
MYQKSYFDFRCVLVYINMRNINRHCQLATRTVIFECYKEILSIKKSIRKGLEGLVVNRNNKIDLDI